MNNNDFDLFLLLRYLYFRARRGVINISCGESRFNWRSLRCRKNFFISNCTFRFVIIVYILLHSFFLNSHVDAATGECIHNIAVTKQILWKTNMLRAAMDQVVRGLASSSKTPVCRRLEGKVAIVTASTQG